MVKQMDYGTDSMTETHTAIVSTLNMTTTSQGLVIGVCALLCISGLFYGALYEVNSTVPVKPLGTNYTFVKRKSIALMGGVFNISSTAMNISIFDNPSSLENQSAIYSPNEAAEDRLDKPALSHEAEIRLQKPNTSLYNKPTLSRRESSVTPTHCSAPKDHVVFVKTHKTGSTSLANILQRYGYYRDLTFALPISRHFYAPVPSLFNRKNMAQIGNKDIAALKNNTWDGYNFLTNHARYNRPEMDSVVYNATYVTILRSPVEHLESVFGYFELASYIGLKHAKNPLASFMEKPQYYVSRKFVAWYWARNGQLFDLGFDHVHDDNPHTIQHTIKQLDFEFDLVLIMEFFDESLLLLRKLLCWEWDDILYLTKGIRSRSHRMKMSDELREKIIKWNAADIEMYNHFNQTLWRRIREYGPTFESDLSFFRSKLKSLQEQCVDTNRTNTQDKREVKPILKSNAPELCRRAYRNDQQYTQLIRYKMISKGLLKLPPPKEKPKETPKEKPKDTINKKPFRSSRRRKS